MCNRRWESERRLCEKNRDDAEKLRREKLFFRRQCERQYLQERIQLKLKQFEDDIRSLETYLIEKETAKKEHLRSIQARKDADRHRQKIIYQKRRNRVFENKLTREQQEKVLSQNNFEVFQNRLQKSEIIYNNRIKERLNIFKK